MIISHKHRFIYYAPVKTATTSLLDVLTHCFEAEVVGPGNKKDQDYRHTIFLPKQYKDYFIFASIRSPYSRALSGFNYLVQQSKLPITDFVQLKDSLLPLLPSLYKTLYENEVLDECIEVRIDQLVRQETLQEDFNRLPFVTNPIEIPKLNISHKSKLAFGIEITSFIKQYYQKDFDYFGYDPDVSYNFNFKAML